MKCDCELRRRQWNGYGKCLTCGGGYKNPRPTPNASPAIVDLAIADLGERDRIGQRRYGTRLQANNGRDALRDAYEEALDLALYLRQLIAERSANQHDAGAARCPSTTDAFEPWGDRPPRYNGRGEPCDMWTGPCSCGSTHRDGAASKDGAK